MPYIMFWESKIIISGFKRKAYDILRYYAPINRSFKSPPVGRTCYDNACWIA